ncbi:MAG: glycosyltransferase 87 family protein [Promethearchaeota archaeon]
MNIRSRLSTRVKHLWAQKIFRYAVILHSFYFLLSIILFFLFYKEKNDFLIFYNVGDIFLNDIENLYNQAYYLWDFRYFPLSAIFFIPFSILSFELAFVVFNIFNVLLNILISVILYKIIILIKSKDHESDDKRVIIYVCVYLMSLPHILNYVYGQINSYITLFILVSLYIFIKFKELKWQFIGSIILGISILIKPTAFFLIPFLIILKFDLEKKKFNIDISSTAVRLVGVMLPVLLNFIPFFIYPLLWQGFLETNFTGSNPVALNFSFSISKLIINFCYFFNIPFNQLFILIGVILIIGGIGFVAFISRKFSKNSIIYGFAFGLIIMLLAYYDSWDHHLLNLIPILIIVLFNLPRNSTVTRSIKTSLIFFSFFNLAFVGIWYLIYPLFPFNFEGTFFLLVSFYAVYKYLVKKDIHRSEED